MSNNETLELPPKLHKLHAFLFEKGDVAIEDIYREVLSPQVPPLREAQQQLGPYVTRLNRRLRAHKQAVRPGRIKGTYVLQTV